MRTKQIRIERSTPEHWRVTLDNPPFNIFGPETIPQLNEVITQLESDPRIRVVVFDSAAMLGRLSRAPVVSIVLIRGRATGVGSELALASDQRFASRERAIL
jgi:enoyl-CoA hydratase/carnithine racemase